MYAKHENSFVMFGKPWDHKVLFLKDFNRNQPWEYVWLSLKNICGFQKETWKTFDKLFFREQTLYKMKT